MKKLLFIIVTLLFAGCSSFQEPRSFIVHRDVPNNPSFAIACPHKGLSNELEAMIIEFGIKVVAPPTMIETKVEKSNEAKSDKEKVTTSYAAFETPADYVIIVEGEDEAVRFRIMKVKNKEILTTFTYKLSGLITNVPKSVESGRLKATFHDAFKKMGAKVKDYYWDYDAAIWYLKNKKVKIKNIEDWKVYANSSDKPFYIPSNPDIIYKNNEWESWDVWCKSITPSVTQSK